MPEAGPHSVRTRRAASIWTTIHPLFAIGQLFAFLVSVGLLVAYFRDAVPFSIVHVSVLVKIGLMVGAVITGSLWEHDVFGWWWFAPEFLAEDVMTLIVFIFQVSYILMAWLHPNEMRPILTILCLAYTVYVANVAQYIHKTQQMKKLPAAPSAASRMSAVTQTDAPGRATPQPTAHSTATHGHGHGAGLAPPQPSGETTHAIVFAEAGRLATHEASLRVAASDEVVVDTKFSSISAGTERLLFSGKLPGFPMLRFPLVPGYESAGIVVRVGDAVTDIRVGDSVFVGGSMCYTDVAGVFGGNAARLIKKAALVVPLNGIPLAHAPLLALAATSLHGVLRLGDVAGRRICVLGMGAIGQFAARFLVRAGASVVCADLSAARLADSPDGCERLDLSGTALDEALHNLDAVVEATGHSEEIARCARALRPGGTIALLSYYDELRTPYVDLFVKEISLLVAREWQHPDLLAARDAVASGEITLGRMADYVVPVAEYERAYRTAFEDPSVPKVILQWA